jgi:hypothetical protein
MVRRLIPLLLAGCVSSISDGPSPGQCESGAVQPGASPVRRMTRFEYNNTVRDLLGDTTEPARDFGAEEEALGFNNNAANLVTTSALADKYMRAAEGIAERATADLAALLPCDPMLDENACARQFIDTFLRRAFRRPVTVAEGDAFFELYRAGRMEDFRTGIAMVIEAALQSPAFLYRLEFGVSVGGTIAPLDGWEMASRLSYFLWGTMPDEALMAAAESGSLVTAEGVAAEARRLLADPKARVAVGEFHRQWLDYDRIASVGKDAILFPEYSAAIGQLMADETRQFLEHAVFDGAGTLAAILTAPSAFVDATLAAFYGPGERRGILTQGTLLAMNAHSNQTSPVHRGKLVREQFLCDLMPPPPPEVMITIPEPDPDSTARERFAQHSENPACSGCHQLMDPIGFGFENYDGVGRYRVEENDVAIDASGELTDSDIDGAFDGVDELSAKLATSAEVRSCYARQWFRYAYGRGETTEDACAIADLDATFSGSDGDVVELLVALTQTDAFRYRKVGSP